MNIYLDFETRSEIDLLLTGVRKYAAHPSTEIICASVLTDDRKIPPVGFCLLAPNYQGQYKLLGYLSELFAEAERHKEVAVMCARNAVFERTMWHFHLAQHVRPATVGVPPMPFHWSCSCELACACGFPAKLETGAHAMGLQYKKDMEGSALMKKMCKPLPQWRKDGTGPKWLEDPDSIARLMTYCDQDVIVDREMHSLLPAYNRTSEMMSRASYVINATGVGVDLDLATVATKLTATVEEELNKEVKQLSRGYIDKTSRRLAVLEWCAANGAALPDYTKGTVAAFANDPATPEAVRRMLQIRLMLGKTSVAKYDAVIDAATDVGDGQYRVFDTLRYNAAMTGRWGGKLVQLQNLPRGNVKDTGGAIGVLKTGDLDYIRMLYGENVPNILSSCVRGVVIPRRGNRLLVGDYSNIEARVLCWLSGDEVTLNRFRNKEDIYSIMANLIYGVKDVKKGDPRRQLGKTVVLGCGYGMGKDRFWETCQSAGMDVTPGLAARAVQVWRSENAKSAAYWYRIDREAKETVRTGRSHGCYDMIEINGIRTMRCRLPSGRYLYYVGAEVKDDRLSYMCVDSMTKKWVRSDIWGGGLVENIDQATSFDLLAYAVLNCFAKGYPVCLTVHDEIISEIGKDIKGMTPGESKAIYRKNELIFGKEITGDFKYDEERTLKNFLNHMSRVPRWGAGIPLDVEGWEGERYKK